MNMKATDKARASSSPSGEAAGTSVNSARSIQRVFVFLCAVAFLTVFAGVSLGADDLQVTVTFANGKTQTGKLANMGEDGSITLETSSGKFTYQRDQYVSASTDKKPPELVAADKSLSSKKYDDAIAMYRTAYEKYKWLNWGEESLYGIGKANRMAGDYQKALDAYGEFARAFPKSGNMFVVNYDMGICYGKLGKVDDALKAFQSVIDTQDNSYTVYALDSVADIQFARKDYEQALRAALMIIIAYDGMQGAEAKIKEAKALAGKCYDEMIAVEKDAKRRERLKNDKLLVIK